MAITIVNDVPQFTDDSNSARVSTVYHQRGGVHVLIGTSTYLLTRALKS